MKSLIIILIAITLYPVKVESKFSGATKLTLQEAERILGEPCYLKESTDSLSNGIHKHNSTYLAKSNSETSRQIVLYYMFEHYGDEASARKVFENFKESNQTHQGFELLTNLGDQAFFQSDRQNFDLIIARKGNRMIRIKVSKITPKTSLAELKKVASEILGRV